MRKWKQLLFAVLVILSTPLLYHQQAKADNSVFQWSDQEVCNSMFVLNRVFDVISKGDNIKLAVSSLTSPIQVVTSGQFKFRDGNYALGTVCSLTYKDLDEGSHYKVYYFVWRDSLRPTYIEVGEVEVNLLNKDKEI